MQRHKPARLDARHFKNTFISSRNEANTVPSLSHQVPPSPHPPEDLSSTPAFPPSTLKTPHTTAAKSSTDAKSASLQRLKLKDYMRLNGIEKRSRSKNNTSLRSQRVKTEETFPASTFSYTFGPEAKAREGEVIRGSQSRKSAEEQNSMMIRQQIMGKIQEERRRLTDLEKYLQNDFHSKSDMSETFVFLFALYNHMAEVHRINEQVGERILHYSRNEEDPRDRQGQRTPTEEKCYHWEEEGKELDSPAKIMKKAMKMTFDLTQLLNITH